MNLVIKDPAIRDKKYWAVDPQSQQTVVATGDQIISWVEDGHMPAVMSEDQSTGWVWPKDLGIISPPAPPTGMSGPPVPGGSLSPQASKAKKIKQRLFGITWEQDAMLEEIKAATGKAASVLAREAIDAYIIPKYLGNGKKEQDSHGLGSGSDEGEISLGLL